jgi:hypothetical protein
MRVTNAEPTVAELLDDPIARLLMARDGLKSETVWAFVRDAQWKLKARGAGPNEATSANPAEQVAAES